MSYLTAIAKARHRILTDGEEPRELNISETIRRAFMDELDPMLVYRHEVVSCSMLMGMHVKWSKPVALTAPQISIRTAKGDTRIVNVLDGDERT